MIRSSDTRGLWSDTIIGWTEAFRPDRNIGHPGDRPSRRSAIPTIGLIRVDTGTESLACTLYACPKVTHAITPKRLLQRLSTFSSAKTELLEHAFRRERERATRLLSHFAFRLALGHCLAAMHSIPPLASRHLHPATCIPPSSHLGAITSSLCFLGRCGAKSADTSQTRQRYHASDSLLT